MQFKQSIVFTAALVLTLMSAPVFAQKANTATKPATKQVEAQTEQAEASTPNGSQHGKGKAKGHAKNQGKGKAKGHAKNKAKGKAKGHNRVRPDAEAPNQPAPKAKTQMQVPADDAPAPRVLTEEEQNAAKAKKASKLGGKG
jgi:hypothetical protein